MRKDILIGLLVLSLLSASRPYAYGSEEIKSIMPAADLFKKIEAPFEYYEAYKKGKLIGYCFNTKEAVPDRQGYSGPMEILVAVDRDYKILNLKITHHTETPEYAAKITGPGFLDQFKGKGPGAAFKIGTDVDAITSATISCNAICDILRDGINKMQKALAGTETRAVVSETLTRLKNSGLEPREASYYKVIDE